MNGYRCHLTLQVRCRVQVCIPEGTQWCFFSSRLRKRLRKNGYHYHPTLQVREAS